MESSSQLVLLNDVSLITSERQVVGDNVIFLRVAQVVPDVYSRVPVIAPRDLPWLLHWCIVQH
jgi:hypothetical protein